eukprot:2469236-Rhodomonas_salina.1
MVTCAPVQVLYWGRLTEKCWRAEKSPSLLRPTRVAARLSLPPLLGVVGNLTAAGGVQEHWVGHLVPSTCSQRP